MTGRYFWSVIAGFFAGVALAELVPLGFSFGLFLILLGSALAITRRPKAAIVAVFLCAAGAGACRVAVSDRASVSAIDQHIGERITLVGQVADEPDRRETSVRLTLAPQEAVFLDGTSVGMKAALRVLVPVPLPAAFSYGDTARVRGVVEYPDAFRTENGGTFDYPAFLSARGVYYQMPFAEIETVAPAGWSVRGALFSIKSGYLEGLQRALPEPHASLAGGITVGDKRSLGKKLAEEFQQTGLVHIVVLSGYNITLIVGVLMFLVRDMPLRWRFALGGGAVLAFVLMTGASATGVRAGAMAVIALLAAAAYRKYAIDRALAITAAGMVLWNPHTLLYDPGFQLSVIATAGLIHLAPFFEEKLLWMTKRFELRSIAAATLGTQAAVLPLLLHQTGLFSIVSFPANLLVLPVIPLAMIASAAAGAAGIVHETLGMIVGLPAQILLGYVIEMTGFLAHMPLSSFQLPAFSGWIVVAAYTVSLAAWGFARKQKSHS